MAEILATDTAVLQQPGDFYTQVLGSEILRPQNNYGNGYAISHHAVMLAGLAHRLKLVPGAEAESVRLGRLAASGQSAFVVKQDSGRPDLEDPVVAYWLYGQRRWRGGIKVTDAVIDPAHSRVTTDPTVLQAAAQLGLQLSEQIA